MDDILKNMDSDKRKRLINSALEEFASNTYEKASTNIIVKKAGISKGLLYHYFESKEVLCEYLVEFSISIVVDAILGAKIWDETDLINRINKIAIIKLKAFIEYPSMIRFSKSLYDKKTIEEVKEMMEKYVPNIYHEAYYKNINFGLFKENVDVQKAIEIIQWTVEKYSEDVILKRIKQDIKIDNDMIMEELESYLQMLKEAFYK